MTEKQDTLAMQIAAVTKLEDGGTHVFYAPSYCEMICSPFGIKPNIHTHYVNPNDPKGLSLDSGEMRAEGMASWDLASQIAAHLGIKRSGSLGRGSAQRENTKNILTELNRRLDNA